MKFVQADSARLLGQIEEEKPKTFGEPMPPRKQPKRSEAELQLERDRLEHDRQTLEFQERQRADEKEFKLARQEIEKRELEHRHEQDRHERDRVRLEAQAKLESEARALAQTLADRSHELWERRFRMILGAGVVVALFLICGAILLVVNEPELRKNAWTLFSTSLTGVMGYTVGRQQKSGSGPETLPPQNPPGGGSPPARPL